MLTKTKVSKLIVKKISLLFACSMLCISFITSATSPITVKVAASKEMIAEYQKMLALKNNQAIALTPKELKGKTIAAITLVILKQALHYGGLLANFDYVLSPNQERSHALVHSGDALLAMLAIKNDSTTEYTLKSSPLGSLPVIYRGVFGLKSNHALMKVQTLEELKKFSAVTDASWDTSIALLQEIAPTKLYLAPSRNSIFKMIAYRNYDFTVLNFRRKSENGYYLYNKDRTPKDKFDANNILLVPVPDMRLQIIHDSSVHFILAKKRPESQKIYQALEKGLAIMRQQGLLKKYFDNSELVRPDLAHLKILNSKETGLD